VLRQHVAWAREESLQRDQPPEHDFDKGTQPALARHAFDPAWRADCDSRMKHAMNRMTAGFEYIGEMMPPKQAQELLSA
jgi:protein involved in temperature-dependent protein secretion